MFKEIVVLSIPFIIGTFILLLVMKEEEVNVSEEKESLVNIQKGWLDYYEDKVTQINFDEFNITK